MLLPQVLIRQELGQDISSACGQLVIESSVRPSSSCSSETKTVGTAPDIEDLMNRKRKLPAIPQSSAPLSPPRRPGRKLQPLTSMRCPRCFVVPSKQRLLRN
jgi:hypothetical protein